MELNLVQLRCTGCGMELDAWVEKEFRDKNAGMRIECTDCMTMEEDDDKEEEDEE
jgi:hypothetical protein